MSQTYWLTFCFCPLAAPLLTSSMSRSISMASLFLRKLYSTSGWFQILQHTAKAWKRMGGLGGGKWTVSAIKLEMTFNFSTQTLFRSIFISWKSCIIKLIMNIFQQRKFLTNFCCVCIINAVVNNIWLFAAFTCLQWIWDASVANKLLHKPLVQPSLNLNIKFIQVSTSKWIKISKFVIPQNWMFKLWTPHFFARKTQNRTSDATFFEKSEGKLSRKNYFLFKGCVQCYPICQEFNRFTEF